MADSELLIATRDHDNSPLLLKTICLGIIIVISASGNVIVMVVVLRERRLHRAPYYYLLNLTVTDFLRTLFCHSFVLGTLLKLFKLTHKSDHVCKLIAFVNVLLTFNSVFTILILAIDRYLAVVYNRFHIRKIKGLICLAIMLLSWGLAFMMAFPPVFGLGTYKYVPNEGQCTFQHKYYKMNDTLGFTLIFTIMILVTSVVFLRIFAYLRSRRRMCPVVYQPAISDNWTFFGPGMIVTHALRHLRPGATRIPMQPVGTGQQRATGTTPNNLDRMMNSLLDEKCTQMCVFIHVAFVVLWFPYLVMAYWYMFHEESSVPQWYVTFATWCTYIYVTVNPLVYVATCGTFRRALKNTCSCRRQT